MQRHLIVLLYMGVFPVIHAVYRRYYLNLNGKTWSDARTYCRTLYTDLASFESPEEISRLQNIATSQNCAASLWVGLYNDVTSWRWSMGNEPLGSFTNWYPPNPDNLYAKESCGAIDPNGWYDYSCTMQLTFICFNGSNSSYIFISANMTWNNALSYCKQHYTDLASARNSTENSILKSLAVNGGSWFGLFRDTWKWADQTNITSLFWLGGEPNNALGQENCVFFYYGQLGDVLCSRIKPFFCETVITGKVQLLRLKVQFNQDVDDSAVKSAISDKIEPMVRAHGAIAVRWGTEINGLVFKKMK